MQFYQERNEQGKRRRTPLNGDLTTCECAMNAACFIEWVAKDQPGHEYMKKKKTVMTDPHLHLSTVLSKALAVCASRLEIVSCGSLAFNV